MYNLFSYFPTYSISKSKIAGTLAETVDISSVVHCSLRDQFVSTTVQNKGFSFETIINADSFSLISKRKQCRCFITLLLLDWALVRSSKNLFWNICREHDPFWNVRSPSFFSEGLPPNPPVFVCDSSALSIVHVSRTCRQVEFLFKSTSKVDSTIKERHKSAPCFATLRHVTIPAWQCLHYCKCVNIIYVNYSFKLWIWMRSSQ